MSGSSTRVSLSSSHRACPWATTVSNRPRPEACASWSASAPATRSRSRSSPSPRWMATDCLTGAAVSVSSSRWPPRSISKWPIWPAPASSSSNTYPLAWGRRPRTCRGTRPSCAPGRPWIPGSASSCARPGSRSTPPTGCPLRPTCAGSASSIPTASYTQATSDGSAPWRRPRARTSGALRASLAALPSVAGASSAATRRAAAGLAARRQPSPVWSTTTRPARSWDATCCASG